MPQILPRAAVIAMTLALSPVPLAAASSVHHRHSDRSASLDWRDLDRHPLIAAARADMGARNFTGLNAAWCAAALRIWLRRGGYSAPRSNRAIDFKSYGRSAGPRAGMIAVLRHHVGIVVGFAHRRLVLISGNHGHRVGLGTYDIHRIVAFREPV
jgi:hypothetical protein